MINFKFPLQPHQKQYITQHEDFLAFHRLLRWKMILLPILTTSIIHFSSKLESMYFLNLGVKRLSSRKSSRKKKDPLKPGFFPGTLTSAQVASWLRWTLLYHFEVDDVKLNRIDCVGHEREVMTAPDTLRATGRSRLATGMSSTAMGVSSIELRCKAKPRTYEDKKRLFVLSAARGSSALPG